MSEKQLKDRLVRENKQGNYTVKGESLKIINRMNEHKLVIESSCAVLPFRTSLTIKSGI